MPTITMSHLIRIITSTVKTERDTSLKEAIQELSFEELMNECDALDAFRRTQESLYEKVRALFFLYALHRFHLPKHNKANVAGLLSFEANQLILNRRFEEGIDLFLLEQERTGWNDTLSSALAYAYYHLALQHLANQVRRSVR